MPDIDDTIKMFNRSIAAFLRMVCVPSAPPRGMNISLEEPEVQIWQRWSRPKNEISS